ncbi:hypothetical protein LTR97_006623 [Elasticomyces elasticus]|uniref:Uncharacterized protein n=1 Tax=Elasticomyces elasticus TaxID=574655 RepID=A0AAN7W352_9PEZI|nr:hypothetical protein LTR97_006623 [Elasticomyces elasticus]
MARTRHEVAPNAGDMIEPINLTRPLSPELHQPPPEPKKPGRFKLWWRRHILYLDDDGRQKGKRLHKAPPLNHPSRMKPVPKAQDTIDTNKEANVDPQPQLPTLVRSTSRASTFGLRSILNSFKHDLELTFLTTLQKEIYTRLTQVTGTGRLYQGSQADSTAVLELPDEDSTEALAVVQYLTRDLPGHEKELMCRDLHHLLTIDQRTLLREVLFQPLEIRCEGINEQVEAIPTPYEEATVSIKPSPARQATVTEPSHRRSTRVDEDNHRFSRGYRPTRHGGTSSEGQRSEPLQRYYGHHPGSCPPARAESPEFAVPGQWWQ